MTKVELKNISSGMTIGPKLTRRNLAEINIEPCSYVQILSCTNTSQICLRSVVFYVTKNFSDFIERNFNRSQVHDLAARKASVILGCLTRSELFMICRLFNEEIVWCGHWW